MLPALVLILGALVLACRPSADSVPPEGDTDALAFISSLDARLHDEIESLLWLSWEQAEAGTVHAEHSLDGETWVAGPTTSRDAGSQQQLVTGIPYGMQAQLRVVLDGVPSDAIEVQTGPLPDGLPTAEVLASDASAWSPALRYALTSSVGMDRAQGWTFILDREGRVVWALPSPVGRVTMQPRLARSGDALLIDHNSFYGAYDGGEDSQVVRVGLEGEVQATHPTPGLHHAFTELSDGRIAWGATDGDEHDSLQILEADGTQTSLWDCADFHESLAVSEACQSNGLSWHESSQRFLFSFFTTATVVEIDAEGATQRWFGQVPGGWGTEPESAAFWWQHSPHYTEAGTLLLSTRASALEDETVVREYSLDSGAEVLEQVWSFGDGQGVYAPLGGDTLRLPEGNTLHGFGSGGRVREITPAGNLVWEIQVEAGTYLGWVTPVRDLYALL